MEVSTINQALSHLRLSDLSNVDVVFHTPVGLEAILIHDLLNKCGINADKIGDGLVKAKVTSLRRLLSVRTYTNFFVQVPDSSASPISTDRSAGTLITKDKLVELLELCGSPYELRYRVEVVGDCLSHEKKQLIDRVVKSIQNSGLQFINDPSNYEVEVRLSTDGGTFWQWSPFAATKSRFSYRISDVPASINPTVAAGIVSLLERLGHDSATKCIDPCCGSGTLLFERSQRPGVRSLVGIDISSKALDAAKQNLAQLPQGVQKRIKFVQADASNFPIRDKFDELISNLPFGIRVGNHSKNVNLYSTLIRKLPAILKPGGVFCFYTQEIRLINSMLDKMKGAISVESVTRVSSGGLMPAVVLGIVRDGN